MIIQPYHIHNNYSVIGYCLVVLIPVVAVVFLALTLCLARQRRRWFLIEPGRLNPYKLIYRVTKFARQHKVPVQRSPSLTVKMSDPQDWTLARKSMEAASQLNRLRMSKLSTEYSKCCLALG